MGNLTASFNALRAVSALVLARALRPVAIMVAILLFAGYALMIMLSLSFSSWWLLLLVLLIPITLVVLVVGLLLRFITQQILPRELTRDEHGRLQGFADKIFGIAEKTKTPYPVILFLIAKDVVRGRESSFIKGLIGDSRSLMKEFSEIQRWFSK